MQALFLRISIFIFALLIWPLSASAQAVPQSAQQMQLSFAPLVKKTAPAVVNIYTKRVVKERMRVLSPFSNDPFFNQFFGTRGLVGPEQERIENSLGSGVILNETGTIATNHHVIKDASTITVVTADGREFEAEKILDDEKVDLAILKINAKAEKLPYLTLADSDVVEVGDLVLAIGNPFGVGQTVTSGIISGLARTDIGVTSDYRFFIQTDAAINPGNSGGALVDMQGRLVGINTAIFSKDGGSLGIGFAIPANMLRAVVTASQHGGKIIHPWSGITSQNVSPDMVESLGLQKAYGTLISKIIPGGPADKAGLKQGDVILGIGGRDVHDAEAMKFYLATVPLGTTVKLSVWRGGKMIDVSMITAPPPEIPAREETLLKGATPLSGAVVANISPAVTEEIGGLFQDKGVVVLKADEGNAARLGLKRGDLVISVNGKKTDTVSALKEVLNRESQRWQIQLMRGEQLLSLTITG
jgi:serine protease Do